MTWEENQATDLTNIRLLRNLHRTVSFSWFRTPPSPPFPKPTKVPSEVLVVRVALCGKTWPQKNGNFFSESAQQKSIDQWEKYIKFKQKLRGISHDIHDYSWKISTHFSHECCKEYANIPTNPVGGFWGGPWPPNPTPKEKIQGLQLAAFF